MHSFPRMCLGMMGFLISTSMPAFAWALPARRTPRMQSPTPTMTRRCKRRSNRTDVAARSLPARLQNWKAFCGDNDLFGGCVGKPRVFLLRHAHIVAKNHNSPMTEIYLFVTVSRGVCSRPSRALTFHLDRTCSLLTLLRKEKLQSSMIRHGGNWVPL